MGETMIQSETGLQGDRGDNVGTSILFNEKAVTDLYVLLSRQFFYGSTMISHWNINRLG